MSDTELLEYPSYSVATQKQQQIDCVIKFLIGYWEYK